MINEDEFLPNFDFTGSDDPPPASADDDSNDPNDPKDGDKVIELSDEADPNVVTAYQFYKEQGLITHDEVPFDGTLESMYNALYREEELRNERLFNGIISIVPDFAQPLLELALNKGEALTKEELTEFFEMVNAPEVSLDSLKDETTAEAYLKNYYTKVKKESEDIAEAMIGLLKDKNKLVAEAEFMYKQQAELSGKKIETAIHDAKAAKEANAKAAKEFEDNFVSGIKEQGWQPAKMQQVYNEFYSGAFKSKLEEVMSDPKNVLVLVDLMAKYDSKKKEFDLEGWKKQVATKKVQQTANNLKNYWASMGTRSGVAANFGSSSNNDDFEFA